jgi:hypothetical protein
MRVRIALLLLLFGATHPIRADVTVDKGVPGWYLGLPVYLYAHVPPAYGGTGPAAPSNEVPDLTVYLTAPVDESAGFAAEHVIPVPGGDRILPAHQDTVAAMHGSDRPADAIGVFVVAGPAATPDTVRVGTISDPARSVAGGALAREIRVGTGWVRLNSHVAIEYGVSTGLLALRPFEYGGLMWAAYPDADAAGFTARCGNP